MTTTVTFRRSGGRVVPREQEDLAIGDDGTFHLWRSVNAGPIGRFGGSLAGSDASAVREAVATLGAAALPAASMVMDGTTETVTVGDRRLTIGRHDAPAGPWGTLFGLLRRLVDERTDMPIAAIGLEADAAGSTARLVHRGTEGLELNLGQIILGAQLFGPGYANLGRWSTEIEAGGHLAATRGWSLDLPFRHGLEVTTDRIVQTRVELVAFDGRLAVPVMIVHTPPLPG